MEPAYEIPRISSSRAKASDLEADLLIVPLKPDARPSWLDEATGAEFSAAVNRSEFSGKVCETWTGSSRSGKTTRVVAMGTGPASLGPEQARRVGATAGLLARQQKRPRLAIVLDEAWTAALVESLVEGIVLSNFDGGHYKTKPDTRVFLTDVVLASASDLGDTVVADASGAFTLVVEPDDYVFSAQATGYFPGAPVPRKALLRR